MSSRSYTSVEITPEGLRVPSCPACDFPVTSIYESGFACTHCEWQGDGYQTAWEGYPDSPQMAPAYINGPLVLTGGRIHYIIYAPKLD